LQGASAIERVLREERDPNIRVWVVWEPVLPTDLGAPSTATLRRVSDPRASQYWDKGHLISRLLGERDRRSVVWDYVAVYPPGTLWDKAPPQALYSNAPVIRSVDGTKEAVRQALQRRTTRLFLRVRATLQNPMRLHSARMTCWCA
jgi:hypothetical protein